MLAEYEQNRQYDRDLTSSFLSWTNAALFAQWIQTKCKGSCAASKSTTTNKSNQQQFLMIIYTNTYTYCTLLQGSICQISLGGIEVLAIEVDNCANA